MNISISKDIATKLMQIKAIKLNPQNPFTWASGLRSPIYCDNRLSLSYPDVRNLVKLGLADICNNFEFNYIAGVATAGIAHGALLADHLQVPFAYVRAEAKSHGRQNQIEGEIPPGSKVLVVEDLISTGGSSIAACKVLQDNAIEVVGVIAIFDYQFDKAKHNFATAGIPYQTVSNYSILMEAALSQNYISAEEKGVLEKWSANPAGWYEQNFLE